MMIKWKIYLAMALVGVVMIGGTLHHFYGLGEEAAGKQQATAHSKVVAKNRKADVKIDRETPSTDKRAAIEWMLKYTRK